MESKSRRVQQDVRDRAQAVEPANAFGVAELAAENRALDGALVLTRRRLHAMRTMARALAGDVDLDTLLTTILADVSALLGCARSTLFLVDTRTQELWSKVAEGSLGALSEIRVPIGEGLVGAVAASGAVLNLKNAYEDPRFLDAIDARTGFETRSVLCVPVRDKNGALLGVVQALNHADGAFHLEEQRLLEAIADQLSVALSHARLVASLEQQAAARERAEAKLAAHVREMDLLLEFERALSAARDLDALGEVACTHMAGMLSARTCVAAFDDRGCLAVQARHGSALGAPGPETWRAAVRAGDVRHTAGRRVLTAAMQRSGAALGVVQAWREDTPFSAADERLMALLAARAAEAWQHAKARADHERATRLNTIGSMLAGVVHDFKTPMTVIAGYVQLMAEADGASDRQQYADLVLEHTDLMAQMTRELLLYARGESDVLARRTSVPVFLARFESLVQQMFAGTGVSLVCTSLYAGAARFDEARVLRALSNLCKNGLEALQGAGHTGTVEVTALQAADRVVFRVTDDGPGLPSAVRDTLFSEFTTHGKADGTGLGLAVVKKIAADHGGDVTVQSSPAGAVFDLALPL